MPSARRQKRRSGSWHLPNRSALAAVRVIAARTPGWTFLVVGSVGRPAESAGRVRVTGPVDDVLPFFRAADVALNPMTEGGGVNLKVPEYLAMGLPVVTTRFGMRGLDIADVVEVAEVNDFPAAIGRLAAAPARRARGAAARRVAQTGFGWEAIAAAREAIYCELIARRARVVG